MVYISQYDVHFVLDQHAYNLLSLKQYVQNENWLKVNNFSRDDYLFKEYLKFLNRLYHVTWFGAVYA